MPVDPLLVALGLLGLVAVVIAVARFSGGRRELPPPEADRAVPPAVESQVELRDAPSRPAEPEPKAELAPKAGPEPEAEARPVAEVEPEARPEAEAEGRPAEQAPPSPEGKSYSEGLAATRKGFLGRINALLFSADALDEDLLEELEGLLVSSDIGIRTTQKLLDEVRKELGRRADVEGVRSGLRRRIHELVRHPLPDLNWAAKPLVVMVIGVNGVGKTTTIGKLAARYTREGRKVVLGAGDTFRAAAVEQLEIWAERSGADFVRGPDQADPSSVMYEAVQKAKSLGADICLCDTAGRLHTKVNLMEELKKVRRTMGKAMEGAPHEVLMVLDSTTGQNAISQAKQFKEAVEIDSIALTKLDGTAKGGVVVAIADELQLPVRFIGIGEGIDDLRDFDADAFVEALFEDAS
ncbi:MAG: signal recognition particle-docking protein FtsY [Myxococcota bacterium]